jgi:putative transposase
MRNRTRNVKRWRDGAMVLRWLAAAFLDAEQGFRRLMGYKDLWMLEAALKSEKELEHASKRKVV